MQCSELHGAAPLCRRPWACKVWIMWIMRLPHAAKLALTQIFVRIIFDRLGGTGVVVIATDMDAGIVSRHLCGHDRRWRISEASLGRLPGVSSDLLAMPYDIVSFPTHTYIYIYIFCILQCLWRYLERYR